MTIPEAMLWAIAGAISTLAIAALVLVIIIIVWR
jgi:hypothetical protein